MGISLTHDACWVVKRRLYIFVCFGGRILMTHLFTSSSWDSGIYTYLCNHNSKCIYIYIYIYRYIIYIPMYMKSQFIAVYCFGIYKPKILLRTSLSIFSGMMLDCKNMLQQNSQDFISRVPSGNLT